MTSPQPAIWFPTVRCGTGADLFTERLVAGLQGRGLRAEIRWLPLRAEYAYRSVPIPQPPDWANLVHVNTWLHPRFIPKHLPVVATLHHAIHDPALRPYKNWQRAIYHRWWIAPIERRVLRRADQIVAVSHFVADMARKTLCDVPMKVIYNGVNTKLFRPGSRQRQPGNPFRLLYVGAWRTLKGVDLIAPIMRELGGAYDLYYTGGAAAQAAKRSMPMNMHDLGRLSETEVVQAMQNADAFLFPSRSEGFGLVVAEAMACGLPVIGIQGSSVAELVTQGVTGRLCAHDDVLGMAEAARGLAGQRRLLAAQSLAARETAETRFEIQLMLDAYINTYSVATGACS